jgi:hypothetical protein
MQTPEAWSPQSRRAHQLDQVDIGSELNNSVQTFDLDIGQQPSSVEAEAEAEAEDELARELDRLMTNVKEDVHGLAQEKGVRSGMEVQRS